MDFKSTLQELKGRLKNLLGDQLVNIVLFGSIARGDYHNQSDIDLAVIVRGLTRKQKHQILDKVAELELEHLMPISLVVFSEDDFNLLKKGNVESRWI